MNTKGSGPQKMPSTCYSMLHKTVIEVGSVCEGITIYMLLNIMLANNWTTRGGATPIEVQVLVSHVSCWLTSRYPIMCVHRPI